MAVPWVANLSLSYLRRKGIVGDRKPVKESDCLFVLHPDDKAKIMEAQGGFVAAIDRNWNTLIKTTEVRFQSHLIRPEEALRLENANESGRRLPSYPSNTCIHVDCLESLFLSGSRPKSNLI
jgi:hypothetical protein